MKFGRRMNHGDAAARREKIRMKLREWARPITRNLQATKFLAAALARS
jgi:hypothetical protein